MAASHKVQLYLQNVMKENVWIWTQCSLVLIRYSDIGNKLSSFFPYFGQSFYSLASSCDPYFELLVGHPILCLFNIMIGNIA